MTIFVDDGAIIRIVAGLVTADDGDISSSTPLTDLVADSFSLVQLAIDVQEEFDVIFYADDLAEVQNVGDLVGLIRSRL